MKGEQPSEEAGNGTESAWGRSGPTLVRESGRTGQEQLDQSPERERRVGPSVAHAPGSDRSENTMIIQVELIFVATILLLSTMMTLVVLR